jgi:electron transfer flavoprotein alpha subunit
MVTLVLAEHDGATLNPATRHAVTAALALGAPVHVLVAGDKVTKIAEQAATIAGVAEVKLAEAPHLAHGLAEEMAALMVQMAGGYSNFVGLASTTSKNIMPRVAALLDVAQWSEVIEILSPTTIKRPIYAGNAIATVESLDAKKVMTVRKTAFDAAGDGGKAAISTVTPPAALGLSRYLGTEAVKSDRPELTQAGRVVSGGRGMGSGENFALVEAVADKLGAAIGASRAAVDAGYAPNDWQVGQTGKIVAPELYVAVGISGAIQHLAGMKDSKVIVAINKDENAPIFEVADYGLVADLFQALPELAKKL